MGVVLQSHFNPYISLYNRYLKCKKALTFRLAPFLNVAGGMGRVWALVIFNKIAIEIIFKSIITKICTFFILTILYKENSQYKESTLKITKFYVIIRKANAYILVRCISDVAYITYNFMKVFYNYCNSLMIFAIEFETVPSFIYFTTFSLLSLLIENLRLFNSLSININS